MRSLHAFFVAAILASLLIDAYDAAQAIELQKGEGGKCTYKGKEYPVGAVWGEFCVRISCSNYDESHVAVQYDSCGSVGAGPGFEVVPGDKSKPYPQCCPQVAPIHQ